MPGPAPKPAAQRARTNKKSTAAVLYADPDADVPILPDPPQMVVRDKEGQILSATDGKWDPHAVEEWEEIWRSPMATMFIPTDGYALLKYIVLVNNFWQSEDPEYQKSLHAEIRITRKDFGLTPIARASLHWEINKAAESDEKRKSKAAGRKTPYVEADRPYDALTA